MDTAKRLHRRVAVDEDKACGVHISADDGIFSDGCLGSEGGGAAGECGHQIYGVKRGAMVTDVDVRLAWQHFPVFDAYRQAKKEGYPRERQANREEREAGRLFGRLLGKEKRGDDQIDGVDKIDREVYADQSGERKGEMKSGRGKIDRDRCDDRRKEEAKMKHKS